jgi:hypothetical protein
VEKSLVSKFLARLIQIVLHPAIAVTTHELVPEMTVGE